MQQKVFRGYAIAAAKIGLPFSQYRPRGASNPLAGGSLLRTLSASFNAEDMKYGKPNKYGKPTWYCVADGTQLAVGDYLQADSGTFFIAAMQPLLPILAVQCNRTVTIYRPQQQVGVGAVGYGGNTAENQTAIATSWPVSLLQASRGDQNKTGLPGDSRSGSWVLLMPAIPSDVVIKNGDIATDDIGNRYMVFSAELTDMGWRMQVQESET